MERLITLLQQDPKIAAWKVEARRVRSNELYYVGKALETNRTTDTTETGVTVYIDQDGRRGASTFTVYPYMDEAQLKAKIEANVYAAGFALNPWYPLPEKAEGTYDERTMGGFPFTATIETLADAVFKADVYENGFLNATEFFLYETTEHILNSNGVDLKRTSCRVMVELIPSWEQDGEEVEIYKILNFSDFDPDQITAQVDRELQLVKARFEARPLKDVLPDLTKAPKILVQEQEAGRIFTYFSSDLDYAARYQHANKFELGDGVQGETVTGTTLTMRLEPSWPGALASRSFDSEGVLLRSQALVEAGKAVGRSGAYRFGYYLGEKAPSGRIPVLVVEAGSKTEAEMKQGPYIRCVKFSGLQLEPNSGYFGGEVRLGFYFDGQREIPVTGFSISGNMNEARGSMIYSAETTTTDRYHGPRTLEITGMKIQ